MNSNNYTVKQQTMHHKFLQYTLFIVSLLVKEPVLDFIIQTNSNHS